MYAEGFASAAARRVRKGLLPRSCAGQNCDADERIHGLVVMIWCIAVAATVWCGQITEVGCNAAKSAEETNVL
jgi:hypothetical protein